MSKYSDKHTTKSECLVQGCEDTGEYLTNWQGVVGWTCPDHYQQVVTH